MGERSGEHADAALDLTDLDAAARAIGAAKLAVKRLCLPSDDPWSIAWAMSIPARPDSDPDLVIGRALAIAERAIVQLREALAALAAAEPARGEVEDRATRDRAEMERLQTVLNEVVDPGDYLEIAGEVVPWRRSSPGLPGYVASLTERAASAERMLSDVSASIGTCRWMDAPDGGDVSLAEQVRRMRAALEEAERETATLTERLARAEDHAELWRFLRDNPLGLRAIDGSASLTNGGQLESLVRQAVCDAALRAGREG